MSRKNVMWTSLQIKRLKECFAVTPMADLEVEFAPHTAASIRATASAMGVKGCRQRDWKAIAKAHVPVFSFGRKVEVGE